MIELLAQESQKSNPFSFIIFLLPLGLLFFLMRSQKRKLATQQALQQQAEVGDEILTTSGIYGTIVESDDDEGTVVVEIAPGTRIKMVRAGISRRLADDDYDDDEDDVGDDGEAEDADEPDDNAQGPIRS
jgi:preprotein translocase subunit YajC